VHCGLGQVDRFDRATVRWPDGMEEEVPGGDVNQFLLLKQGSGQVLSPSAEPAASSPTALKTSQP
jgi:hypothetical protein